MLWQQQHDRNGNQSFRYKVVSIQIQYKLKQWNCTAISIVCVKWRMFLVVVNAIYATVWEAWKNSGLQLDLNLWPSYTVELTMKPLMLGASQLCVHMFLWKRWMWQMYQIKSCMRYVKRFTPWLNQLVSKLLVAKWLVSKRPVTIEKVCATRDSHSAVPLIMFVLWQCLYCELVLIASCSCGQLSTFCILCSFYSWSSNY